MIWRSPTVERDMNGTFRRLRTHQSTALPLLRVRLTIRMFLIRALTVENTLRTSRPTVVGEGNLSQGRPSFMSFWYALSLTIEKGRLFSATQRACQTLELKSALPLRGWNWVNPK